MHFFFGLPPFATILDSANKKRGFCGLDSQEVVFETPDPPQRVVQGSAMEHLKLLVGDQGLRVVAGFSGWNQSTVGGALTPLLLHWG